MQIKNENRLQNRLNNNYAKEEKKKNYATKKKQNDRRMLMLSTLVSERCIWNSNNKKPIFIRKYAAFEGVALPNFFFLWTKFEWKIWVRCFDFRRQSNVNGVCINLFIHLINNRKKEWQNIIEICINQWITFLFVCVNIITCKLDYPFLF